jgi:dimethylhistidine N-methyltransferase
MGARFPRLPVRPVVADFTAPVALPLGDVACARRVAFFPGSTIGNFDPPEAVALLRRMALDAGKGGMLLIGVDLPKDEETLVAAYDDARGVTAAFDLNLLARMNRELAGDFRLSAFRHRAIWDARLSRVEMHLESREAQVASVAGRKFHFDEGETIHTESAHKWEPRAFDALAAFAGWRSEAAWTDERAWFAVKLYRAAG